MGGAGDPPKRSLSSLKNSAGPSITIKTQRSMTMLNAIYRAIIIGRAKSAANYAASNLSDRQLSDFGHSRSSFISASVQNVMEELEEAEKRRNHRAIRKPTRKGLWTLYT